MSSASASVPSSAEVHGSAGVNPATYFLLRRLHSLTGVFPLGVFLLNHLFTNSFAAKSPQAFNEKVEFLRGLPLLPLIEWGGIFIPLALHAILGVMIALQAKHNPGQFGYARNWMYSLQRWSGWLVLGFIIFHVGTLRFAHNPDGPTGIDFYSLLHEMFKNPVILGFYILGGLATIHHFANGLCTFCMTWGLTVTRNSQRAMAAVAAGIGMLLLTLFTWSLLGFMGIPTPF